MPKLAIYVPKPDMKEIDRWRKKINFSKVFMRALREEIRERLRGADGDQRLSDAAAHYRRELEDGCRQWDERGYQAGWDDVLDCRLSPDQIRRLLGVDEGGETGADEGEANEVPAEGEDAAAEAGREDALAASVEGALGKRLAEWNERLKQESTDKMTRHASRREFYRGYVRGVAGAWKRVQEQL